MLGVCRKVTLHANVMKLGTVGHVRYVITLISFGPHRLTGFGVSRHPSWVPAIDKAHRAYCSLDRDPPPPRGRSQVGGAKLTSISGVTVP